MSTGTSPYVFPFRPFRNLSESVERARFHESERRDYTELRTLAESFTQPLALPAAGTLPQRLLSLFEGELLCLGKPEWIALQAATWLPAFSRFIDQEQPILFSLFGFPFKAPVPLKTKRRLPDFGELVMLCSLEKIVRAIGREYEPGARVHVFAEGALSRSIDFSGDQVGEYYSALENMSHSAGCSAAITLHDSSNFPHVVKGFDAAWERRIADIEKRQENGDAATIAALNAAYPVIFHLIATDGCDVDTLRQAYQGEPAAATLRASLDQRARKGSVVYRAFLEARDDLKVLEKFCPNALPLTVSPRPGRLGVSLLPRSVDVLPYHGVSVVDRRTGHMTVEYWWDIVTSDRVYTPVTLRSDPDTAPFLLEIESNSAQTCKSPS